MHLLNQSKWILFVLLGAVALSLACSTLTESVNDPADLDAASTEIAAEIFATQTAEAPEATDTVAPSATTPPTDTPEPTSTPEPTETPTETPEPTDTPSPEPTNTPRPTNTRVPDLVVDSPTLNLRNGPGLVYAALGVMNEGDTAMVIGQAYDCGWLQVRTEDGDEGWITGSSQYVDFNMECAAVAEVAIPPTPTSAATATPDRPTIRVQIENETGGPITMYLNGPAVYNFTIQAGNHFIDVVPGTYSYTVNGCGGATANGTINFSTGDVWTWFCE